MSDDLILSAEYMEKAEQAFEENSQIKGHLARLDNRRLVFIGRRDDDKECLYIAFRNPEGDDTRLKLTREAMAMLVQLYNKPAKGEDIFPLVIKTEWKIVAREKINDAD